MIDRLMDLLATYDLVRVADLYELVGFDPSHSDYKWGWTDLRGSAVTRLRSGGYLLDLPDPKPVD